MKREVFMVHSGGRFYVEITNTPRWVLAKDWVWDRLCTATGGWLGGHGMPDMFWKIPTGWPKWDHHDPEEPWLINSVANLLCDLESWVLGLGADPRVREPVVARIQVDEDVARKLDPVYMDTYWVDDEAMEVTFDKGG